MLNPKDFNVLKARQYCDNPECDAYTLVGKKNIRIHSRSKGQVYCSICKNRWVVTKGTISFGLKTPIDKVIQTILMMARGTGLRKVCRRQGITPDTAIKWIKKATKHTKDFTRYMKKEMQLEQALIDEFKNFIQKKQNK